MMKPLSKNAAYVFLTSLSILGIILSGWGFGLGAQSKDGSNIKFIEEVRTWKLTAFDRLKLPGLKTLDYFQQAYRSQNIGGLKRYFEENFAYWSDEQRNDVISLIKMGMERSTEEDSRERREKFVSEYLDSTGRWPDRAIQNALVDLAIKTSRGEFPVELSLSMSGLSAMHFFEHSVPELKLENRYQAGLNWSDNEAFLWTQTEARKDESQIAGLLNHAYSISEDEVSIQTMRFDFEPGQLSLPDSSFSNLEINSLSLLRADFTTYELKKNEMNRQPDDDSPTAESFFESLGFLVASNSQSKPCSFPVIGQSVGLEHWLFVGLEGADSASFSDKLAKDSPELGLLGEFEANGQQYKIFGTQKDKIIICESSFGDSKLTARTNVDSLPEIEKNYSVFRFFGIGLRDPLNQNRIAYLIRQVPNVRRGLWSDCPYPEDKNWFYFGRRSKDSEWNLFGGRFYPDTEDELHPKLEALAGSKLENLSLDPKAPVDLSVYLPDNSDKARLLKLVALPSMDVLNQRKEYIRWMSRDILRDPF